MGLFPKLLALAIISTLTFAAPTSSADLVADVVRTADPCPVVDDDETGLGGQEVSCAFTCGRYHVITVQVHADDEDASVAGEGACSDVRVTCGEHDASCEKTSSGRTSSAGGGTCAGRSEEFWDSGLRVDCWSTLVPEDDVPPRCIVNPPSVGCVPPCQPVGNFEFCLESESTLHSAHIWSRGGMIFGAICVGGSCQLVAPVCEIDIRGGYACRIGS